MNALFFFHESQSRPSRELLGMLLLVEEINIKHCLRP